MPYIKLTKAKQQYAFPKKSIYALTFRRVRSFKQIGKLATKYTLHIL